MAPSLMRDEAPAQDNAGAQRRPKRHWRALTALTLLVAAIHAWLTYEVSLTMRDLAPPESGIKRMEATYVSEVKLTEAPTAAAVLPPPPQAAAATSTQPARKKRKPKAVKAASAPQEVASAAPDSDPAIAQAEADSAPEAPPLPAWKESAPRAPFVDPAATQSPASDPTAPGAPTFVWPKATRVNYTLQGHFRGPFFGNAAVEWVREGSRYQVRLDASIPLGSVSMISEGEIRPEGLSPRRYESVNRMVLAADKVNRVQFEETEVVLGNGERVQRPSNVQDPVSHLIQLAYSFIINPAVLKPGNVIEMPLAYAKKVETLAFDVVGEETLHTDMGNVPTMHVRPRRMTKDTASNLVGEIWFAPGLQYLPVRILARFNNKAGEEITLDMTMKGAPQQTPGDANMSPPY